MRLLYVSEVVFERCAKYKVKVNATNVLLWPTRHCGAVEAFQEKESVTVKVAFGVSSD